jgi:hypothetical protein
MTEDRAAAEAMAVGLNAAERDTYEELERQMRWRERRQSPPTLRVNVDDHMITSPSGAFTEDEIVGLERKHREDVERHRRDFRPRRKPY